MKKIRRHLTYANVMSSIAVFLILGGATAVAAKKIGPNQLKAGAVKTGKLAKEAVVTGKIKNGAVTTDKLADLAVTTPKIADNAVTGVKVDEATLGIVPDAAKLAGKEPTAYESKGFGGAGDSATVTLPAGANTTTVQTLNLPAGSYLVLARGGANNNGAAEQSGPTCTVAAGGTSQAIGIGELGINVKAGDREEFSAYIVATLAAAGSATLKCTTGAGWESGNVIDPSLAAVSLQP